MSPRANNAKRDGIIKLMSFAGACAVVVDDRGKIVGCTPKFKEISNSGKAGRELRDIFQNLPDIASFKPNRKFKLVLKDSGKVINGKVFRESADNRSLTIVLEVQPDADANSFTAPPHYIFATDDLVFQYDSNARVYHVSNNVQRIIGYSADDFISGRVHPLDVVHPDDKKKLQNEFTNLFVKHESVEGSEHRVIRKDGGVVHFLKSWYPMLDANGNFCGMIGLNKDITTEKFLQERVQLFNSAFEHSTDAIVITNVDGIVMDVNEAFTSIYGYSREEAIGNSTALIQSRHSTREFYREMWESLRKYGRWKGEIINRRKDGMEIPVWLSITPIYLDGAKIGYMGIESDTSDKRNLEQQIMQTEKLATIGQLAVGIAHEIGTPLNIISGNAEFMLLDMNETDRGYQELSTIIGQTKRMSLLMRQLLDFARPKILSLQPVDVNSVITEVLDFVRPQSKTNQIEIGTSFGESVPKVYGDPALLYQVFLNLIVNSLQAMAQGGELRVESSVEATGGDRERVVVSIRDTGEGIPPENLEKVFAPFFTTKEPGKGTGLGLAVTHRIIQEHNGKIEVESEVGKGTVVTIRFNAFSQK